MGRMALTLGMGIAILALAGCTSGEATLINDLRQTGVAYHNYHEAHRKGPGNWDELIAIDKSGGGDGQSIVRVRDAGYQMQWDVVFRDVTAGLSNTVLAENPSGGPKLIMDGSVRK